MALGEHSRKPGLLARLGAGLNTTGQKRDENMATDTDLIVQRWGPPQSPHYKMVMRYWLATRMQRHWEYLHAHDSKKFRHYMEEGYMEPIPTSWVESRHLASRCFVFSLYETQAEKRLYYLLNHGVAPDGTKLDRQWPLNNKNGIEHIIARGEKRTAREVRFDVAKLAVYQSPGDVFLSDKQTKSRDYSAQVPMVVSAARQAALSELAAGIANGTDHLETMLLIDISDPMTWNPHQGIEGPDHLVRRHDQPSNIRLVEHLVHRVLQHMIPRAQKEHHEQKGIDTVTFSDQSHYIGPFSTSEFRKEWTSKVRLRLGGGTQVLQGWQVVKQTYFEHQNRNYGHGRLDPKFGWQATPGMPKLSLLIFLGSEADDMDEFELELLGETWAYVTIALIGMEGCPYHHSYAAALERVAQFNPRVGLYGMQGRVCERTVVKDLLSSVYPVAPPQQSEIVKLEFDLPREEVARFNPRVVYPVDPPQYSEIVKPEFDLQPREELPKHPASQGRTCADKQGGRL